MTSRRSPLGSFVRVAFLDRHRAGPRPGVLPATAAEKTSEKCVARVRRNREAASLLKQVGLKKKKKTFL